MLPIAPILAKIAAARAVLKRRTADSELAQRTIEYRYQPDPISVRGIFKILLVLAITHGIVWYKTRQTALANFAAQAERVAAEMKRRDAATIAYFDRQLALARNETDEAMQKAKLADAEALAIIEELTKRPVAGWPADVVRAINGDPRIAAPKPKKTQRKAK